MSGNPVLLPGQPGTVVRVPITTAPAPSSAQKPMATPMVQQQQVYPAQVQGVMVGGNRVGQPVAPNTIQGMQIHSIPQGSFLPGLSMQVTNSAPPLPAATFVDPNAGVKMPSRQYLEQLQIAQELQNTANIPDHLESEEDLDKLLDSNYAIILELVRLRQSRAPGRPTPVERKLMELAETNLATLIIAQPPQCVVSARAAQATRSIIRPSSQASASAAHVQGQQITATSTPHTMGLSGVSHLHSS